MSENVRKCRTFDELAKHLDALLDELSKCDLDALLADLDPDLDTLLADLAKWDIGDLVSPDPDLDALLTDLANSEPLPEPDVDLDALLTDLEFCICTENVANSVDLAGLLDLQD